MKFDLCFAFLATLAVASARSARSACDILEDNNEHISIQSCKEDRNGSITSLNVGYFTEEEGKEIKKQLLAYSSTLKYLKFHVLQTFEDDVSFEEFTNLRELEYANYSDVVFKGDMHDYPPKIGTIHHIKLPESLKKLNLYRVNLREENIDELYEVKELSFKECTFDRKFLRALKDFTNVKSMPKEYEEMLQSPSGCDKLKAEYENANIECEENINDDVYSVSVRNLSKEDSKKFIKSLAAYSETLLSLKFHIEQTFDDEVSFKEFPYLHELEYSNYSEVEPSSRGDVTDYPPKRGTVKSIKLPGEIENLTIGGVHVSQNVLNQLTQYEGLEELKFKQCTFEKAN